MTPRHIYDAWKIKPPCEQGRGCHQDCPYYTECNGEEEDEEEDDAPR